jgi:hypothetical protein
MKLEYIILDYLNKNDNGNYIDVTFINENHSALKDKVMELKGKNLILIDDSSSRDFEAFGITNAREKRIKAKIKMNGKIYLHSLKKINNITSQIKKSKRSWNLAYLFNF